MAEKPANSLCVIMHGDTATSAAQVAVSRLSSIVVHMVFSHQGYHPCEMLNQSLSRALSGFSMT